MLSISRIESIWYDHVEIEHDLLQDGELNFCILHLTHSYKTMVLKAEPVIWSNLGHFTPTRPGLARMYICLYCHCLQLFKISFCGQDNITDFA